MKTRKDCTLEAARLSADLVDHHKALKATRQRGEVTPNYLAGIRLLNQLEEEMKLVRQALDTAWSLCGDNRQFRKCSTHMDSAQQRLHRAIKKIRKNPAYQEAFKVLQP